MAQLFKQKKEIQKWLNEFGISNYQLISDPDYGFIVDVHQDVNLMRKKLKNLGVKFNIIHGDFLCEENRLTSLQGSPNIVHGNFTCSFNKLTSLEYCPQIVKEDFFCFGNKILNYEFCPQEVGGLFLPNNTFEEKDIPNFKDIYQQHLDFVDSKNTKALLEDKINVVDRRRGAHKI